VKRIGVIGGTFDPIHVGHLDAAAAARHALVLDQVIVMPSFVPPHRGQEPRASPFHRFALAALAVEPLDGYRVSDAELRRAGPSYTADTMRELHASGLRPAEIFFILGGDAFLDIAAWHAYPSVLEACHFVVIARGESTIDARLTGRPELAARVRPLDTRSDAQPAIFLVPAQTRAVSSTDIRDRLAAGHSIDGLVPPNVARHIHQHGLYGSTAEVHGRL